MMPTLLHDLRAIALARTAFTSMEVLALRRIAVFFSGVPAAERAPKADRLEQDLLDDADPAVRRLADLVIFGWIAGVALQHLRRRPRKEAPHDA